MAGNPQTVKISLADGRTVTSPKDRTLLAALRAGGVLLPTACGGRGACGLCRCTVRGDAGVTTEAEKQILDATDLADGVRLACQVTVDSDLAVAVPEGSVSAHAFKAVVSEIRELAPDMRGISLSPDSPLAFRAGQFIQLRIPAIKPGLTLFRQYSIASPPSRPTTLELIVRRVPNGQSTGYIFESLRTGQALDVSGPYGEFRMQDSDRNMLFAAGGSGFAPVKAMLEDMADKHINRPAICFFGARSRADLFCLDTMAELGQRLPNLKFVPVLSAPDRSDQWDGATGLVTEAIAEQVTDCQDLEAYLCGSPAMVAACEAVLLRKGIPRELIFYDKFG